MIVAHIYLDHIITEVLNEHLDYPEPYFSGHRPFAEKLGLCRGSGYFRDDFGNLLKAINNARNRFARKLVFHVSDEEKRNLFRLLTTERPISEVTKPEGFGSFLLTVVMFAEFERTHEKRASHLNKEANNLKHRMFEILRAEFSKNS